MVRLSSLWTFWMKFVFPPLWLGGFAAGTVAMFVAPERFRGGPPPLAVRLCFVAFLCYAAVWLWSRCLTLKRVRTDGGSLYVSNYFREEAIPFGDVGEVGETRWSSPRLAMLHFRRATAFGWDVVFLLPGGWLPPWRTHPVVEDLRRAIGIVP